MTDPDEAADSGEDASDAVNLLQAELDKTEWTNAEFASQPLKAAGFSKKQIWAASRKLGVIRKKGGMKEGWYWRLAADGETAPTAFTFGFPEDSAPKDSTEDSEGSDFQYGESSESSGEIESLANLIYPDKTKSEPLPIPSGDMVDVADVEVF